MDQSSRSLNFIFLSSVNGLFFFIGIFLNSIVIVALLKSNQHLKSLCSFMILVCNLFRSCYCSRVPSVVNNLSLHLVDWRLWLVKIFTTGWKSCSSILFHFSFMALLVMNIDRILAVSCPFFHKQNVTRRRLMALLGVFLVAVLIQKVLAYRRLFGIVLCHVVDAVH